MHRAKLEYVEGLQRYIAELEAENRRLRDIYGDPDAERISVPKIEWAGLQRWKDRHKCCPND